MPVLIDSISRWVVVLFPQHEHQWLWFYFILSHLGIGTPTHPGLPLEREGEKNPVNPSFNRDDSIECHDLRDGIGRDQEVQTTVQGGGKSFWSMPFLGFRCARGKYFLVPRRDPKKYSKNASPDANKFGRDRCSQ